MRAWRRNRSRHSSEELLDNTDDSDGESQPRTPRSQNSVSSVSAASYSASMGRGMSENGNGTTKDPGFLGESLIPVVNKIQDIFNEVSSSSFAMELPQVAVVGSQSSGKSSVLEALVGRDFLPRGPDICTRRPLVLQLVKTTSKAGAALSEWGEFLHVPGKRFYDFERIRMEILAETERVVGINKGVSDKPIRLRICSPRVLTMTLVDLPGITRVPVGDQPADIEDRIRRMVLEYIRMESCIILAVTAGNSDIANSDSLQMARQVDPEGCRTIGVLTKLDIMDRGTDAADILRNKVVPLRLGYVGVINRSQHDINVSKTMSDAMESEGAFFENRPEYAGVMQHCGAAVLAKTLNSILIQHIQTMLPSLRQALESQVNERSAELSVYGESAAGASTAAQGAMLLRLVSDYADSFGQMVNGNYQALPTNTIAGGARIRYIFKDIFVRGLDELAPSEELSDEDIRTAIRNSGGVKGSLLIPEEPFELLTRRALAKLQAPALQCYEFVYEELARMAEQCMPRDFSRFPILERRARDAAQEFIALGCATTEQMICNLLAIESSYINTDHPQFVGGSNAVALVIQRRRDGRSSFGSQSGEDTSGAGLAAAARNLGNQRGPQAVPGAMMAAASSASGAQAGSPAVVAIRGGLTASHQANGSGVDIGLKGFEQSDNGDDRGANGNGASSSGIGAASQQSSTTGWFSGLFGISGRSDRTAIADGGDLLKDPPTVLQAGKLATEQDHIEVEVTRLLVQSYFDIVRRNLQDSIPKAVMHFLVVHAQKGLQQHLIRELYKEELFEDMMSEREEISARRAACHEQLSAARASLQALDELPRVLSAAARESRNPLSSLSPANLSNMASHHQHSSSSMSHATRKPASGASAAAMMAAAALQMDSATLSPFGLPPPSSPRHGQNQQFTRGFLGQPPPGSPFQAYPFPGGQQARGRPPPT